MIGSSPNLRASAVQPLKNPIASLSGISKPRLISDQATESAANNAIARGYQKGFDRPARAAKAGFSVNAYDRMAAAQADAQGSAEGAAEAAGIRAEDQAFNESQRAAHQNLIESRLNSNYELQTGMAGAGFNKRFAAKQNGAAIAMAVRAAQQRLRLALLSRLQ
jgi:hypothetical protein